MTQTAQTAQSPLSIKSLQARARLLAALREFFAERGVLEVETPLLGPATGTDPYIDSFPVPIADGRVCYLQTSPEFGMKRLLAAGSGSIYQICKVFRAAESGRLHNPEFTMLEWYRPGFSIEQLMDEVGELLLATVPGCGSTCSDKNKEAIPRFSYRYLFQQHLNLDPHRANLEQLAETARCFDLIGADESSTPLDKTAYLQRLMTMVIEPRLPEFCFVYDYPAEQCALARIKTDDTGAPVARRFELYGRGMELANGYDELTDAIEQRRRFEADLKRRRAEGRPLYPIDEPFLAALDTMPSCAGVALGVDRLLMLITNAKSINEVLNFSMN